MARPAGPPVDPVEALAWMREALAEGRVIIDTHYYHRCRDRRISPRAWRRVIETATACTAYSPERGPLAGGTSWRVVGLDFMEEETSIGVETYLDHLGRRLLVITVF